MSEYITLLGSEEVIRAGHQMERAARAMDQAAAQIADALMRHERFLAEWLDRLESVLTPETPEGGR